MEPRHLARIAAFLLFTVASSVSADTTPLHSLSLGATYQGGQIHVGLGPRWATEAHALTGSAPSTAGTVTATVFGVRLLRYFRAPSRLRFYLGVEGAALRTQSERENYHAKGTAAGGFLGAEIYVGRRVSFQLDAGPYFFSTKEERATSAQTGFEMVLNSTLNFYFL